MDNKKERLLVFSLFVLAFFLRLAYTFFLEHNYFFVHYPSDDVPYYQNWAHEIAGGNWIGNKVFSGMPLYPYFLAIVERLTLGNLFSIRLIHLLLGSINVCLVYWLAKKIFSSFNIAFLSGILAATNFILIYYDWLMMPVTLIIFLSLMIALSLVSLDIHSPKRQWGTTGAFIGLGMLADGKFAFVAIGAVIYLLSFHKTKLTLIAKKILFPLLAGILIVLSLVTLRNRLVSNDWVFISAQTGLSFYAGNNPRATGVFERIPFIRPNHQGQDEDQQIVAEQSLKRKLKPSQVSGFWTQKALSFIMHSPEQYLQLLLKKLTYFLTDDEKSYDIDLLLQNDWKWKFDLNSFRLIAPLAILGIFLAAKNYQKIFVLNIFVLSQLVYTLVFFLTTRQRTGILPFLLIFEAAAIVWLFEKMRTQNWQQITTPVLVFLILFIYLKPQPSNLERIEFLRRSKAGSMLIEQKRFAEAEQQLLEAFHMRSLDSNNLYNLGILYTLRENFTEAIKYFQYTRRLNPYSVNTIYNLAYSQEQLKNFDKAISLYGEVINISPTSYDAHLRLANIYRKQKQCQKAREHYTEIIQNIPQLRSEILPLMNSCTSTAN